jgi:hypothetical protein
MTVRLNNSIAAMAPELTEWRRDFNDEAILYGVAYWTERRAASCRRARDPSAPRPLAENLYHRLRAGRRLQLRQNRNSPCYPLLTGERGPRRTRI